MFFIGFGSGGGECESSVRNSFRRNRWEGPSTGATARRVPTSLVYEVDEVNVVIFLALVVFVLFERPRSSQTL